MEDKSLALVSKADKEGALREAWHLEPVAEKIVGGSSAAGY